jgi:hypothetical protein
MDSYELGYFVNNDAGASTDFESTLAFLSTHYFPRLS